ncbi:MFS transporter [Naumannella halotolerans]|uniref:DHA3 family multidrug efflux protein-like MFS transporter n=1 Tax=Naumannella halotolerans TaxID=993414 RepID=A0A4R7J6X6_9ACTN|nr:MFS transporter [Naumannella halotolerans]TDT32476.1 DHA3 family multidrug efflux protein-like MFS transporter [Naumannella halotolerans]
MTDGTATPRPQGPVGATMRSFHQVLVNTAVANITSSYLWWGLTFWAYLETRSVLATSIIGGSYMLLIAVFGMIFGGLVDRMRKKAVMVLSSSITVSAYLLAGLLYLIFDVTTLVDWSRPWFWLFAGVILIGGVVEHLRNIALSTTVTLLVPADRRDRANGLVGTVQGLAFMVTSVFSGLSIGLLGMGWTVVIATAATGLALAHLLTIAIPEERIVSTAEAGAEAPKFLGLREMLPAVLVVPGLLALILFSTFNNLVGGVFLALMDPYGLTLFSVEAWGVVLGVTSTGFIIGGMLVAKFGLGKNPVRTMLLVNVGIALLGMTFAIRELWWLYALGIWVFMCLTPMAEATEQTIIQRVVPFAKQGRVFGFAASVEAAAAPVSSFLVGPLAEFVLIPYMESREGRQTFGWLLGDGEARGIALAFVGASLVMLLAVVVAFVSRPYRRLSAAYAEAVPPLSGDTTQPDDGVAGSGGDEVSSADPPVAHEPGAQAQPAQGQTEKAQDHHEPTRDQAELRRDQDEPAHDHEEPARDHDELDHIGEAGQSIRDTLR